MEYNGMTWYKEIYKILIMRDYTLLKSDILMLQETWLVKSMKYTDLRSISIMTDQASKGID